MIDNTALEMNFTEPLTEETKSFVKMTGFNVLDISGSSVKATRVAWVSKGASLKRPE